MQRTMAAISLTVGTGLVMQLAGAGDSPGLMLLRAGIAGGFGYLGQERLPLLHPGLGVLALARLHPAAGWAALGAAASAVPVPGALMAALGAELGGIDGAAGVMCLTLLLRLQKMPWRAIAPGAGCLLMLAIQRRWEPLVFGAVALGGCLGSLCPPPLPRRGKVGAVRVKLEQLAGVLNALQQSMLDYTPPEPDTTGLTEQLHRSICSGCIAHGSCPQEKQLNVQVLLGEEAFHCRRESSVREELTQARRTLRRAQGIRAARQSCRQAMVQQYSFLADTLRGLSDRLEQGSTGYPRFRAVVSVRSRSRFRADGDRVTAFAGMPCRYYVLLCDGMGTGLGASEESRSASELIRRMLTAGLPPESVLGSINSQLTLTNRGGAVTVDLAELCLDSGRVWLYKWGANPSWILRRHRGAPIGTGGPPPGLGIRESRENISHACLDQGETLVMVSDGIPPDSGSAWASQAATMTPADLASHIINTCGSPEDDATAVVVRLVRK